MSTKASKKISKSAAKKAEPKGPTKIVLTFPEVEVIKRPSAAPKRKVTDNICMENISTSVVVKEEVDKRLHYPTQLRPMVPDDRVQALIHKAPNFGPKTPTPPISPARAVLWSKFSNYVEFSDDVWTVEESSLAAGDNSVLFDTTQVMSPVTSVDSVAEPTAVDDADSAHETVITTRKHWKCPCIAHPVPPLNQPLPIVRASEFTANREPMFLHTESRTGFMYFPIYRNQVCIDSGAAYVECQMYLGNLNAQAGEENCPNQAVGVCATGCCTECYCLNHVTHETHTWLKNNIITNWDTLINSTSFDQDLSDAASYFADDHEEHQEFDEATATGEHDACDLDATLMLEEGDMPLLLSESV